MLQPPENKNAVPASNANTYTPVKASSAPMEQATIGRSLVIKGDISGAESLFVDGRIEGTVNIPEHRVTVGRNGVVTADVNAREVVIMGKVQGNIICSDRLDIRSSRAACRYKRPANRRTSRINSRGHPTQNRTATPPKRQPLPPERSSQPEQVQQPKKKGTSDRALLCFVFVAPASRRQSRGHPALAVTNSDQVQSYFFSVPGLRSSAAEFMQ
jgi:cytoskeletal protein CcmA (bactofilin family)